MMMRSIFASIAALSFGLLPALARAQSPAPPSAETFYRQALEHTRDHLEPAFATYQAKVDGLDCSVEKGNGLDCRLKLSGHVTTKEPFEMAYRTGDDRLAVQQQGNSFVVGDAPFLNATWQGVDGLIRYGFIGKPPSAPQTAPSIDPQSHLKVIAVVSALSPDAYHIEDVGPATCGNGDAGHTVHLIALRDPLRYPLEDATVDMRTDDLCMVRFGARANAIAGLFGANGVVELNLENQNGFVVVQDERFDIYLRTVGIAVKHVAIGIGFSDYAFPKNVSPVVFTTPEPSPSPSAKPAVSPKNSKQI